uniref:RecF/RecN/SMC N-terminal domain-containing protein n=1 Tax=Kwoniella bestiolae CBS 10118 TaxID=1296100 RepID=A0A1B9G091_9TREE|nr:hypothetical protein I302_05897 [Kwoniella bestiolae CBS 10118]OCF24437.1 hypothetical protein I302_05897 [Kwoniella bestiolae CBS 10118]
MARAGAKRPSPSPQSDAEDGENVRAREIKRVKRENHVDRSQEEEDGDDSSDASSDSVPDLEEEEPSDDDSSMDEYEEVQFKEDALVKAYEAARKRQKGYVGATSEGGVLKSINLVDFMCHRHLTVEFGHRMNFLVGHNGSGKSAVLTAIAIALGGKAMTTGRGQGLKDLIRKGADKAIITVVMANSGPRAFKPDVYDPHIVIERTISLTGATTYRFRASRDGRILANKRSELTAICENFNINIDSPLTILTQDQARSFLQSSDPGQLYKFFLKGTQLSALLETYESSMQNIDQINTHIKRQTEAVPALKEKVDTLQRKLLASDAILKQKDKYKTVLDQLAWSYVTDKEQARDEYQETVNVNNEKMEQAQNEAHKHEKKLIKIAEEIRQTEKDLDNFDENRKPLQKAVQDAKEKVKAEKKAIGELDDDINTIKDDIETDRGGLQILQSKIDAKLRLNADAQRDELAKLVDARTRHEEFLNKLKKDKPKKQQQQVEKAADLKLARVAVTELENEIEQKKLKARNIQGKITNLQGQSINRLSAFGQGLDNVMKDIQRTKWKHSPPLGPLGMYVKLEDMYYRDIVQAVLGQNLCTFAVRDVQDRATLTEILRRHSRGGYRPGTGSFQLPPILLHGGDRFDYKRGDQGHLGPTILSKLSVNNEDVLRLLITLNRIERTFLARTVQEANNEMKRLHNNRVLDFVNYYSADHQQISGTNSSKTSGPVSQWRGNTLFTRDLGDDVKQAQDDLKRCEDQIQELAEKKLEAQQKVQMLDKEVKDLVAQIKKITNSMPTVEQKLDDIRRQLSEMTSTEMENWEADREERMRQIEGKEIQLQAHLSDKEKRQEDLKRYQRDIADRQKELDEHTPQRTKQEKILTVLVQQRSDTDNKRQHYEGAVQTYQTRRDKATAEVESLDKQIEEWSRQARAFCPVRAYSDKTTAQLAQERTTLDAAIKEAEKQLGVDTSHLASELRKAKTLLKDVVQNINQMRRLNKVFHQAMRTRRTWWADSRNNIAVRAKTAFVVFESLRDMDGRLDFEHKKEKLSLVVTSTTRTENAEGELTQRSHYKTPKNLSGGERSFSTVSFLLALWSTVPCPIRALDEWDVFLDHANRKVAAKSLMDGARESDGKQYILITPQDMSGIEIKGPDMKLIRMADPNRNQ